VLLCVPMRAYACLHMPVSSVWLFVGWLVVLCVALVQQKPHVDAATVPRLSMPACQRVAGVTHTPRGLASARKDHKALAVAAMPGTQSVRHSFEHKRQRAPCNDRAGEGAAVGGDGGAAGGIGGGAGKELGCGVAMAGPTADAGGSTASGFKTGDVPTSHAPRLATSTRRPTPASNDDGTRDVPHATL